MAIENLRSMPGPGMIALGAFVVALILLLLFGYGFLGSLFLSLVLAAAVSAFVLFASRRSPDTDVRSSSPGNVTPSTEPASASSGGTTAAPTGSSPSPEETSVTEEMSAPEAERPPTASTEGTEPERLDAPREGGADDLKRIKGIGPKLETELHRMGIFHIDQIAGWSGAEVAWMDENLLEFRGRVSRDDWVGQARQLRAGEETSPSNRPEDGEVSH